MAGNPVIKNIENRKYSDKYIYLTLKHDGRVQTFNFKVPARSTENIVNNKWMKIPERINIQNESVLKIG